MTQSCCPTDDSPNGKRKIDPVFYGSLAVIVPTLILYFSGVSIPYATHFSHSVAELLSRMWWGIALGIIFVGLMGQIRREYFTALLGRGDTAGGIIRAAIAGLFLDLCSHGILMVGAKLYERGASLAQVMTFLIASPWNSLSLTIILIALIGLPWTLIYIAGSALIAVISGLIFQRLVKNGTLPDNPNTLPPSEENFPVLENMKADLKAFRPSARFFKEAGLSALKESRMIIKWLLFGVIIAASIRTFVPTEIFADWFGPSLIGLLLTLVATTIIEVCSEGSAPIASELVTRASAPGNGFAFLMAGVSTDYTEMLVLREFTKSWKISLFLPLVTVPQVVVLGYIMNMF
ncbi:MAG: permease [Alphaproteobacteria bacterium]|nr:permease [Alphaproteobacteria bacterium]